MTELMSLEWFYQIIWVLKAVDFLYKYPTLQSELKWQHRRSTYFAFIWISCFSLQTSIVQNILEGIVCITRKTAIVTLRFRTVHQVLHAQRQELAYFPDYLCFYGTSHRKCPARTAVALSREEKIVIHKQMPVTERTQTNFHFLKTI